MSKDPAGWGKLKRSEWGAMKLGHTHPEYSNSGLLSVLAIAYAGLRTTRGLVAADKMVERGPSYLSAAVLYENLVIESYAKQAPMPLVAIYPVEGTFWSDHPFGVLDADWVEAADREAAGVLLAFPKRKQAQEQALALGFHRIPRRGRRDRVCRVEEGRKGGTRRSR